MNNPYQEPLDKVLDNYDITVKTIKIETYKDKKAVWWVETDKGRMVLKKVSSSEQTLKFLLSALRHLRGNGIHLAPIIKTKSGADYTVADGTCYVLSGAVDGKSPSYENDLEIIVRGLAEFHTASHGFKVLPDTKPKIHLGNWVQDLSSQLEKMRSFYDKEASVNGSNKIGQFIVAEFPYFYERALDAIDRLSSGDYTDWVEKGGRQGVLCHQDFAAGNLLLHPSGKLYVLDTDGITVDIPARDIRKILCKIMKKRGKWEFELTKRILKIYQSVNPLEPSEWRVVMTDIMFPHLFLGAMNKYCFRRDKEWTEEKYYKRIKEMCAFEKTIEPILKNFDALIPQ